MPKKLSSFDTLAFEISVHLDPKIMPNEKIDVESLDVKKLKKYLDLINTMTMAFKKIQRYELYFSKFYASSEEIQPDEALEHHVHAYLQDLTILKNKIEVFLNTLRNDLKKIASNKKEVCDSIDAVKSKMLQTFEKVKETRDPHHHAGSRFLDYDIVRSSSIRNLIKNGKSLFAERMKPGAAEYLNKEANESFEKAKAYYIDRAKKNAESISKLMDMFFLSIEDLIYQFLGIKPIIRDKLKNVKWTDV